MNEQPPLVDLIPQEPPDILPPPQQQSQPPPIPMPSQTPPPPFNAPAKKYAAAGVPVTQETFTKQTIYSGGGPGGAATGGDVGVGPMTNKSKSMIEYLNSLHFDPNAQTWSVQIDRIGPPKFEGHVLVTGPIEQISPPIPYRDVIERVREIHGGGKFTVKIVNDVGQMLGHIPLNIETINCPPVIRGVTGPSSMQTGYRTVGGNLNGGALGAGFAGDDELAKIRQAESLARANKARISAEYDTEETQRTVEKRRKAELDAEERRKGAPEVESLRASIIEMNHSTEMRMRDMQASFEKNLLLLAGSQKKDDSQQHVFLLIAEMMKSTQQTMVALMTNNNNNKQPDQMAEIIRMTSAANDKVVQMALSGATKNDKLLESLIIGKLEHPENAVKQALELRESGFKQAMQMHEMFEERRNDHGPDEVINPESGFWGNLGNVILSNLQGLFSGGAKGAGKQFVEAAAQLLQKPAGTPAQQFNQQDLERLSAIMVQQQKQNAAAGLPYGNPLLTPAPHQPAALPAPVQQQQPRPMRRLDPYKIFDRVYEVEAAAVPPPVQQWPTMPMPQQVAAPVQQPPQQQQPLVEEVEEVTQVPQIEDGGVTLQDYVNEAVKLMLTDLKRNVREHDWVDCAISKWDEDFLQALATAPDDTARLNLIKDNADPALFEQVAAILMSNQIAYERFVQNMEDFVREIKDPETSGATS